MGRRQGGQESPDLKIHKLFFGTFPVTITPISVFGKLISILICKELTGNFGVAQDQPRELHQLAHCRRERTWARTDVVRKKCHNSQNIPCSICDLELIIISAFGVADFSSDGNRLNIPLMVRLTS